jgi:hypothetical protein
MGNSPQSRLNQELFCLLMVVVMSLIWAGSNAASIPLLTKCSLKCIGRSIVYSIVMEGKAEGVVPELTIGGLVDTVRSKDGGFSGANREASSPVNTNVRGWPFRTSRLLWNTFSPKGCLFLRQLVWINTLEVRQEYVFKTVSSLWAEVPSKSSINFRCWSSLFL